MENQSQPLPPQGQSPQIPQPPGLAGSAPPINNSPLQPPANPPSRPVNLPLSNVPLNSDTQNTVVVGSQNVNFEDSGSRHLNLWLIFAGAVFLILIIGAALYLWFLPTQWANSYLNSIKPLYQQQASQMTAVFQSTGQSVFTGINTSLANDNQQLSNINSMLDKAISSTAALKTKNHLTVLPGTTWLHAVSSANSQYQAMQQYLSDSQAFLTDYKTLAIYTEQIIQVGQVQLPPLLNDFYSFITIAGANNETAFIAAEQQTSTDLQNFTNQVKSLKPSTDMQQYNKELLDDLSSMNSSLQSLQSAMQGNMSVNVSDSLAVFQSAVDDFVNLLDSNPTANIQTNSKIHDQITILEGEHPLQ